MPTQAKKRKRDDIIRIPVVLGTADDKRIALAVKHAVEKREGRDLSWAALVRYAFRVVAAAEGVKCK